MQGVKKKSNLGSGLESFIGKADNIINEELSKNNNFNFISLNELVIGYSQPRKIFDEESIQNLSESIKEVGIIQPLLVRPLDNGKFEIIAGERRYRAAKIANINEVPVIIKELSDIESHKIAIIENIQRVDLNPIEEALGYDKIINEFGYTQDELSKSLSKSRSYIANSLRLLKLDDDVKDLLITGQISSGHARTLVGMDNQIDVANKIINESLSVRDVENINKTTKKDVSRESIFDIMEIKEKLKIFEEFKMNVSSNSSGCAIKFNFKTLEELEEFYNKVL